MMNKRTYFFLLCLAGVITVHDVRTADAVDVVDYDSDDNYDSDLDDDDDEDLRPVADDNGRRYYVHPARKNTSTVASARVDTTGSLPADTTKGTSANPDNPTSGRPTALEVDESVAALDGGTPTTGAASLPEATVKTMRITLQNIHQFIPLLAAEDQSAQFVPHAIRILELMENFKKEVSPADLQKLGMTQEFARTKLLLEKSINNKQIQVASKLLELYGTYESDVDQESKPFSLLFKTQALALFGNRVTSFTVQDPALQGYFEFKSKVQSFLQAPGAPDRAAFLALVKAELQVALNDKTQLQINIANAFKTPLISGDAAFEASFARAMQALDTQDKQLQQVSQNAVADETVKPVVVPVEPMTLMELLDGMKSAKGLSVLPDASFEMVVKNFSGRVAQLQTKSAQVQSLVDLFTSAVIARGSLDASTLGGSVRNQNVQLAQIALKTGLDDVQRLYNQIDADRQKIVAVIKAAQGTKGVTSEKSLQLLAQRVRYESLLTSIDAQLGGYKKQLLAQQVDDFVQERSDLIDQIGYSNQVRDRTLRMQTALQWCDLSLPDAVTYGPKEFSKQIQLVQGLESKIQIALQNEPTQDLVQQSLRDLADPKGLLQKAVQAYVDFLPESLYGKETSSMAVACKQAFDGATKKLQTYLIKIGESLDGDVQNATGLLVGQVRSDVYDAQNELFDALYVMDQSYKRLLDMAVTLPRNEAGKQVQLVEGVRYFYTLLGEQNPLEKLANITDGSSEVVKQVETMLTANFALTYGPKLEDVTQKPVYQGLLEQIGIHQLGITRCDSVGDYYVLTDLEADRVKKELQKIPTSTLPVDCRSLPKVLLRELGLTWLTKQGQKELDEADPFMTFEDEKLLCLSWAQALRDVKLRDKPFRDISANLFSSPFARSQYATQQFPKGYVDPDHVTLIETYGAQQEALTTALNTYQLFIARSAGKQRAGILALQNFISPLSGQMADDIFSSSKQELISMVYEGHSLSMSLQANQSGSFSRWQQQLGDQVQAIKQMVSRFVLAKQLAYAVTTKKGDTQQLTAIADGMVADQQQRIQECKKLVSKVQSGDIPTLSELEQLYVAKITLGLEQQLYSLLMKTDTTLPVSADITALDKQLDKLPIPNPELYQKLIKPVVVVPKKKSFLSRLFPNARKK